MDFLIFILNVAIGWWLTLYIVNNTDVFPKDGGGFLLVLIGGIVAFFVAWWIVVGWALGLFIYRRTHAA